MQLSAHGRRRGAVDASGPPAPHGLALMPGEAPIDVFPLDVWVELRRRAARHLADAALRPSHAAGWTPLRRTLATRLAFVLGRDISWDQVLILPARGAALRLVAGELLAAADRTWIERPGDPLHRAVIVAAGGTPSGLPLDLTSASRFAVVSLGASIPFGARLSRERRAALEAWACAVDGWYVEDDLGGNLLLDPAIDATGPHARSVIVGSFGKLAAPGVDLAYVVAPPALRDRLVNALLLIGYATPTLHQAALDALFAHGAFDLHVDRLRIEAPARLDAFRRGIASDVHADALAFTGTIELDGFAAEQVLLPRCQAAGFGVMGLSRYDDARGGLVVGFAGAPAARIETEAARLGALLRGARC